jgi:glycerate kinase
MRLTVLIVPDKFKGTLTAKAAAEAIARGWRKRRPSDSLELLPMSDGGDGFGEVLSALLRAVPQTVNTRDAAHRPCTARWWWQSRSKTALIDTAGVVGLAMLPPRHFHPFDLDTFGLGNVVRAALAKRPRRILVGLGGSATNDGGFGLARALGWEFLNASGKAIERWTDVTAAAELQPPEDLRQLPDIVVAVDVQNPLLGPRGASRIYGPQKGLRPRDFRAAERCLRRLALLVRRTRGSGLAGMAGAGAAGGLGFGFAAFLQGRLEAGFELFAREVQLDQRLRQADLVVTGEGAMDSSTFMGKGAGQIASRCRALGIPCFGLAGMVSSPVHSKHGFTEMHALTDLTTLRQAKAEPALWLERLATQTASRWPAAEQRKPRNPTRSSHLFLNSLKTGVPSGP